MNKRLVITLIILLSLITISLIIGLVLLINNNFPFKLDNFNFDFNPKSTLIYDKNIEDNFNTLDIYSKSLDFKFIKSTDNNTNIKIYDNKKNNVSIKTENNTLKIISNNKNTCFFCFTRKRKAVISLPDKIYDLILQTKSGDIISDIDFNKVDLNSTSGDIKFNGIKDANIKVTSGDIIIKEVDNLKIKSISGDLLINKINKQLDIKTTSGDININYLTLTTNSNIEVTSGDVNILKASNDIYYNTNVLSGDVKINNNNRHANTELIIKTKSGDININN